MPHNRKKRARDLSQRTGMSHQAAVNSLEASRAAHTPPSSAAHPPDHHKLTLPARTYPDLGPLVRDLYAHLVEHPDDRADFGVDAFNRTLGFATAHHKWRLPLTAVKTSGSTDPLSFWCQGIAQGAPGEDLYAGWLRLAAILNGRAIPSDLLGPPATMRIERIPEGGPQSLSEILGDDPDLAALFTSPGEPSSDPTI
jgi:hypothetical protein